MTFSFETKRESFQKLKCKGKTKLGTDSTNNWTLFKLTNQNSPRPTLAKFNQIRYLHSKTYTLSLSLSHHFVPVGTPSSLPLQPFTSNTHKFQFLFVPNHTLALVCTYNLAHSHIYSSEQLFYWVIFI